MVEKIMNLKLSEVMLYLQIQYVEGIVVICSLVVAIHLIFSIRLLFTSRDANMKLFSLAFIPGLNVFLWLVKCIKKSSIERRESRILKDDEEITL